MKKLLLLLMLIGVSAMAQTKYVGRFIGDGLGLTNINAFTNGFATTNYVNNATNDVMTAATNSAKSYTDSATNGVMTAATNSAKAYTDNATNGVMTAATNSAKAYTDNATNGVMTASTNSAFTYTVNATNGVMTASTNSAKSYTDNATNGVMTASTNSAKAYTDNATNGVMTASTNSAKSYTDTATNGVMTAATNSAKAYTDNATNAAQIYANIGAPLTNGYLPAVVFGGTITGNGSGLTNIPISGLVQPGIIHTNGMSVAASFSNAVAIDAAHFFYPSNLTAARFLTFTVAGGLTNLGVSAASPINQDGTASTSAQVNTLFPSNVLTNGNSFAVTFSNALTVDAAHFLYASNVTAAKVLTYTTAGGFTNTGLAAVPINGDATATTAAQVNTLFPGNIHTNGNSFAAIFSNAVSVDAAHFLYASNITAAKVLTYTTAGGFTNSGLGAVPINGDATATTAAQVNTLFPANLHTNGNSFAAIFSNAVSVDAAHFLYASNITAAKVLTYTTAGGFTNSGLGAVSINGDATATTFAQINALGPSASGIFITNNGSGYTNSGNIQASTFNGNGAALTNVEVTVYCGFNLTPAFITGVNNVYPFVGNATGGKQTTEGLVAQSIPGGILTNLFVKIYAVPAGTNVVFTVMTNGVASSLTANANGGGAATAVKASDTTHSCTVANGDTISMKIVGNNASASAASVTASWSLMQVR